MLKVSIETVPNVSPDYFFARKNKIFKNPEKILKFPDFFIFYIQT